MTDTANEISALDVVCGAVGPLALSGDRWSQLTLDRLAVANDQEAEARKVGEEIVAMLTAVTYMLRPYVKAALADRRVRAVETLTDHGLDADEVNGETEHLEDGWKPHRFMLLERNHRSEPPYYLTTHRTAEAAGAYHYGQEYYADWAIEMVVDLDTGDRYEVEQKFIASKVGG